MTKNTISIVRALGTPNEEKINIETEGYIIFYLIGEKIKSSGDIEVKALAPILLKLAMEKLTKG